MTTSTYTELFKRTKSAITQDQRDALNRLELELIHYRNTGIGKQFLVKALDNLKASIAD